MNREEYEMWELQAKLTNDLLARVEHAEHAILTEMGCPMDPVEIFAILNPRPKESAFAWRKRTAVRDKQRAEHAMNTLALIAQARGYLGLGTENAQRAAHAALLAGLHANDAAANAAIAGRKRRAEKTGGRKRGAQIAKKATEHDHAIRKHFRRWQMSEELQDEYRSPAAYVQRKTKLPRKTVERSLKRIQSAKSRQ